MERIFILKVTESNFSPDIYIYNSVDELKEKITKIAHHFAYENYSYTDKEFLFDKITFEVISKEIEI